MFSYVYFHKYLVYFTNINLRILKKEKLFYQQSPSSANPYKTAHRTSTPFWLGLCATPFFVTVLELGQGRHTKKSKNITHKTIGNAEQMKRINSLLSFCRIYNSLLQFVFGRFFLPSDSYNKPGASGERDRKIIGPFASHIRGLIFAYTHTHS